MKAWLIYAGCTVLLSLLVIGVGWSFADEAGRNGLLFAGGVAVVLQCLAFGALMSQKTGTPGLLAAWVASSLLRGGVVVGAALWVASTDAIDTLIALLTLVGLLFVLLLLEPVALRWREGN